MNKVSVVFRREENNEIVALFPYEVENKNQRLIACYSHVGQHATADYDAVIDKSEPVSENEYKDLYNELCFLGYDLSVLEKASKRKMDLAFQDAILVG